MGSGSKLLFFISALGAFHGLILAVYFLFFSRKKHLTHYLLGALLLVLSLRIGKSVVYYFDHSLSRIYLQVGLTACFFIGPFLYFFIRAEMNQVKQMPKAWTGHIVSWFLLIAVVGAIYPYEDYPLVWGRYFIPLIYLQWGFYMAFGGFLLIPLIKKAARKESTRIFEKWIMGIWAGVLLLFISYVSAYLNLIRGSYILGAVLFSVLLYIVAFILLYRKKTKDLTSLSPQKYADRKLHPGDAEMLIAKLQAYMLDSQPFKDPGLKLGDLAGKVNISGHQLSQLLNDHLGKNFTLFINEYRINEACTMLVSHSGFTIEAIGEEVGFNSKSTFFATFKKLKGMTPNAYLQSMRADL